MRDCRIAATDLVAVLAAIGEIFDAVRRIYPILFELGEPPPRKTGRISRHVGRAESGPGRIIGVLYFLGVGSSSRRDAAAWAHRGYGAESPLYAGQNP